MPVELTHTRRLILIGALVGTSAGLIITWPESGARLFVQRDAVAGAIDFAKISPDGRYVALFTWAKEWQLTLRDLRLGTVYRFHIR